MNLVHKWGDRGFQHIVVLRALRGLGDFLCAVPAWRALRGAFPSAHITLIGLSEIRSLLGRFPGLFDEWLEFPGFPGIPERPAAVHDLPGFLTAVQARHFDLALQMHGSGGISNLFTMLLGASTTAGFYVPGQYCPDPRTFLAYPAHEPEIRRYLRLLQYLGLPAQADDLAFVTYPADHGALAEALAGQTLQAGRYICIHPGAHEAARRWAPELFAQVADSLAGQGWQVVLTGSAAEQPLTAAVAGHMRAPVLDLAGRTGLGALAALLQGARLLICNDTGVSHLAAALRTPSVVIFLASDQARWAPLDRTRHRVVAWPAAPGARPEDRLAGTTGAQRVLAEAQQLLLDAACAEQLHVS